MREARLFWAAKSIAPMSMSFADSGDMAIQSTCNTVSCEDLGCSCPQSHCPTHLCSIDFRHKYNCVEFILVGNSTRYGSNNNKNNNNNSNKEATESVHNRNIIVD